MSEPLTSQTHLDHAVVKHLGDYIASVSFCMSKWFFKLQPQAFAGLQARFNIETFTKLNT